MSEQTLIEIPSELAAEVAEHPERFRPNGFVMGTRVLALDGPAAGQIVPTIGLGGWEHDRDTGGYSKISVNVAPPAKRSDPDPEPREDAAVTAWAIVYPDAERTMFGSYHHTAPARPGDRILILEGEQAGRLATVNPPPVELAGGGQRLTITEKVDVERYAVIPPKVLTAYEEYQQIIGHDGLPVPEGLPAIARLLVKHVGDAAADSGRTLADRQMFALVEEFGEYADACAGRNRAAMAEELADALITTHVTAVVLDVDLVSVGFQLIGIESDPDAMLREAAGTLAAYRRWQGMARRRGSKSDVAKQLAVLQLSTHQSAELYGIDLTEAVRAKLEVIFTRGWREPEMARG